MPSCWPCRPRDAPAPWLVGWQPVWHPTTGERISSSIDGSADSSSSSSDSYEYHSPHHRDLAPTRGILRSRANTMGQQPRPMSYMPYQIPQMTFSPATPAPGMGMHSAPRTASHLPRSSAGPSRSRPRPTLPTAAQYMTYNVTPNNPNPPLPQNTTQSSAAPPPPTPPPRQTRPPVFVPIRPTSPPSAPPRTMLVTPSVQPMPIPLLAPQPTSAGNTPGPLHLVIPPTIPPNSWIATPAYSDNGSPFIPVIPPPLPSPTAAQPAPQATPVPSQPSPALAPAPAPFATPVLTGSGSWVPHPRPHPYVPAHVFWGSGAIAPRSLPASPLDIGVMHALSGGYPLPGTAPAGWSPGAWPPPSAPYALGTNTMTICPWLVPNPVNPALPHLKWDISQHPSTAKRITGREIIVDLAPNMKDQATYPPAKKAHIVCDLGVVSDLWGPIIVESGSAITVGDVINAIYEYFQKQMGREEVDYIKSLKPENWDKMVKAMWDRCARTPSIAGLEWSQGLRRVDCLGDATTYWGMWATLHHNNTWQLNIGLRPPLKGIWVS